MDSGRKRKLFPGEGSSSGAGGAPPPPPPPPPGWREAMHSSVRVRNRALLAESLYLDLSEPISVDEALTTATWMEQDFYDQATTQLDYLLMVSDNTQEGLHPEEIGEEPVTMPTDLFKDLLRRHRDTTGCLKNLVLQFNLRQPIPVTSGQQLAVRLHKLRASVELVNELDDLKEQIESVQERSENNLLSEPVEKHFLEKAYELMIGGFLETFSSHIKNICDCPKGVTVDVDTSSASVDLTSQMRDLDNSGMQPEQKPLAEVHSSSSSSILPPQHQLPGPREPLGSNENHTHALLDNDLLAEIQAWLNIPDK